MDADDVRDLHRLIDYLEWAHGRILDAARATGDPELRRLFDHLVAAEHVWIARLEGEDSSGIELWPERSLEQSEERFRLNLERYRRFLAGLGPGDVDRPIRYRNSSGDEFRTPVAEILHHVSLHGAHHRGQAVERMRELGEEPVDTLFITFVREHPATPGES